MLQENNNIVLFFHILFFYDQTTFLRWFGFFFKSPLKLLKFFIKISEILQPKIGNHTLIFFHIWFFALYKKKFREFIRYNNLMTTFHYLKQKITDKYHELFKDCEGTPINTSDKI